MFPGSWSLSSTVHRLRPPVPILVAVVLALVLAGTLGAAVAATPPPTHGSPAQELLLGPFRWTPLSERAIA